ncbi:MAG: YXWGXW repeat-containing protein [Terriglobales bacterium]
MRKRYLVAALALLTGLLFTNVPVAAAQISVGVSVRIGPPPLRVVAVQPMGPGPGYLWTPGYWAYGPGGYYWVSGAWVLPPGPGLLWTPGYWGWGGGLYAWHTGYWGPHVGFYGGVNYGYGYFGSGFVGGRWAGGRFFYNTAVWRVNTRVIHTTYVDRTVIRDVYVNRVSYNGGPGGLGARPNAEDARYAHERHQAATPMQTRHEARMRDAAIRRSDARPAASAPSARASANRRGGSRPETSAAPRGRARQPQAGRRANQDRQNSGARGEPSNSKAGAKGKAKPESKGRGRGGDGRGPGNGSV